MGEFGIRFAELLPNAFDECADVRAIAYFPCPGGETFAMNDVVELSVLNVRSGAGHQIFDDLKFRHGQFDQSVFPVRALDIAIEPNISEVEDCRLLPVMARRLARLVAPDDQFDALKEYRKTPRL